MYVDQLPALPSWLIDYGFFRGWVDLRHAQPRISYNLYDLQQQFLFRTKTFEMCYCDLVLGKMCSAYSTVYSALTPSAFIPACCCELIETLSHRKLESYCTISFVDQSYNV